MSIMISSYNFLKVWTETVIENKVELSDNWENSAQYTKLIIGSSGSILSKIASKLNLLCYENNYYFIDAVFYHCQDKTPNTNENTFWFRDLRIAFEHENKFNSGLYQEISHLLLLNCDLKVLVTYPDRDVKSELNYIHEIIKGNRNSQSIDKNENFLIIFGYRENFTWEGWIFKEKEMKKI